MNIKFIINIDVNNKYIAINNIYDVVINNVCFKELL